MSERVEPNVFELADARERMVPQPAGPPDIEMSFDDERIIFRNQEVLDEYVRASWRTGETWQARIDALAEHMRGVGIPDAPIAAKVAVEWLEGQR